jgi:hypothetical protein
LHFVEQQRRGLALGVGVLVVQGEQAAQRDELE